MKSAHVFMLVLIMKKYSSNVV